MSSSSLKLVVSLRQGTLLSVCFGVLQVVCFVAWAGWVAFYLDTLSFAFTMSRLVPMSHGIMWYLLALVPGVLEAIPRIALNNVDLYVPNESSRSNPSARPARDSTSRQLYRHDDYASGIRTWFHIIKLQLYAKPYRLLVHSLPSNPFYAFYYYITMLCRFGIFIWGSIIQGNDVVRGFVTRAAS